MLAGQDVLLSAAVGVGGDSSSGSHRRFADSAAVAALKDAAVVDPVAPLRCPAALMLDIAGACVFYGLYSRWSLCLRVCGWARNWLGGKSQCTLTLLLLLLLLCSLTAEQCREARQLQQQLEVLSGSSMAVSASITAATNQEEQLQAKVRRCLTQLVR